MVPAELLVEHGKALAVVWLVVLLAGTPLNAFLRLRLGFAGCVMLGMVAWSVVLYALPFDGGLDVALVLAILGCAASLRRFRRAEPLPETVRDRWVAPALLAVGCVAYSTLILWNYVPLGVDAGMVGASARLISLHQGLPRNYDPWFPELFFPTVNLGMPTIGAVAVRLGCEPGSVVLALAQLTFSAWILSAYLVMRCWVNPPPAAVLAVAQAWGARWAQNTVGWGGFPTVAGVAIGLLALRLLWDLGRRGGWRQTLALGLSVGAIPLVHGVSAAVWLYVAAPPVGMAALLAARDRRRMLAWVAAAAGVSVAVLVAYLLQGQFNMSQPEVDWSLRHMCDDAPVSAGGADVIPACASYLIRFGGSIFALLGISAWCALVALGRWREALLLLAAFAAMILVLANSHWLVLPFTMMLYPDRAVYWAGPLAALALALAWRAAAARYAVCARRPVGVLLGGLLLALAFSQHVPQYQQIVWRPPVDRDGWDALCWARKHIGGRGSLVAARYGSLATYLPACAGVASTAWQIHHCAMEETQALFGRLKPTHRLCVRGVDPVPQAGAQTVFENSAVIIVELRAASASARR